MGGCEEVFLLFVFEDGGEGEEFLVSLEGVVVLRELLLNAVEHVSGDDGKVSHVFEIDLVFGGKGCIILGFLNEVITGFQDFLEGFLCLGEVGFEEERVGDDQP